MHSDTLLQRLDEVIARLPGNVPCELLHEHLGAARRNLLACAHLEYALNLEQALDSVRCIRTKDSRTEISRLLQTLQVEATAGQRR